jgi:phospholipid-binding lipoprotein MlaA
MPIFVYPKGGSLSPPGSYGTSFVRPRGKMMRVPLRTSLLLTAALSVATVAGCATKPPASDPDALAEYNETNDPLEPTNRVFYKVNNAIDAAVLRPAAKAYRYVFPDRVRTGVHNVLVNLTTPVVLSNDMMQGKPRRAGDTTMRFLINTTVGVVGLMDVAKDWGYPAHDTDFGVTLALWGLPAGPFLFLPVLGPTDPRDAAGFGVNIVMDPFTWVGQGAAVKALDWSRFAVSAVDQRERALDAVDSIKKTALDPYATFRSLFRQHRESQIEDTRNDKRATIPVWFPQPAPSAAPAAAQ